MLGRFFPMETALEAVPGIGELMLHIKVAHACAGKTLLGDLVGSSAQNLAPFTRRIIQMQDHVCDAVNIKLIVFLRQFNAPATDCAHELEWQVPLVPEIEFEQARVVLPP